MEKHVFVTGASSGLGRATALQFARMGYRVLAGVRREADADSLRAVGVGIVPVIIELADAASVERAAREVDAIVGESGLAVLVNNAGHILYGPIEYTAAADVNRLFEVLVFAQARLTNHLRAALRRFRGARPKVLNVISWSALEANPFVGYYAAAKAAFLRLSQGQYYEFARYGIDVAAIVPGLMRTPFVQRARQQIADTLARLPAEAVRSYGRDFNHFATMSSAAETSPVTAAPEAVARRIVAIAGRARLYEQYKVGIDTRLVTVLSTVLPFWALRRIKIAMFGLDDRERKRWCALRESNPSLQRERLPS